MEKEDYIVIFIMVIFNIFVFNFDAYEELKILAIETALSLDLFVAVLLFVQFLSRLKKESDYSYYPDLDDISENDNNTNSKKFIFPVDSIASRKNNSIDADFKDSESLVDYDLSDEGMSSKEIELEKEKIISQKEIKLAEIESKTKIELKRISMINMHEIFVKDLDGDLIEGIVRKEISELSESNLAKLKQIISENERKNFTPQREKKQIGFSKK